MKTTRPTEGATEAAEKVSTPSAASSVPNKRLAVLLACLFAAGGSFLWDAVRAGAFGSRGPSGTYTLPAGNPVVTGTTISTTWANNTLGDIATTLTNSLDRNGNGPMLAPLQLNSGSIGLPGLTWSSENGLSGWYRIASHDFGLSVNGVKTQEMTASSSTYTAGAACLASTCGAIVANGAVSDGGAIVANGGGAWGVGVIAQGGQGTATTTLPSAAGGAGVFSASNTAGAHAIYGYGTTTGSGVYARAGSSGVGAIAQGGGSGVTATPAGAAGAGLFAASNAGDSPGMYGFGSGAGAGGAFRASSAATGGTRRNAISAVDGDIDMSGVANVASTTAISKSLTPSNIVKAWVNLTPGASPTINDGFNIASATCGSNKATINFAQAMADGNYVPACSLVGAPGSAVMVNFTSVTSSSFVVQAILSTSGAVINMCGLTTFQLVCFVIGNQ